MSWFSEKIVRLCVLAAATAVLAVGLSACGGGDKPAPAPNPAPAPDTSAFVPYDFTDSCGRTVTITEPITRVAVSGPTAQQVMLSFAPDTLVGLATKLSPDQIKYVGNYGNLPVLGQLYGGKGDLNKEAVAAAMPQIMIDWGEAKGNVAADMDDLSLQLGIPCVHIEANLATYDQAFTLLGQLLGMEDRGASFAGYCAGAYKEAVVVQAQLPAAERQSGIMTIYADNLGVIAKGSYQSQVFDMWVDNIAVFESPSAKGTGNAVDLEQVATWNPAFVLFAPGDLYEAAATDPVWNTVDAIANGNYLEIPEYPYNWMFAQPSVNQVLGMQWLPRVLYPEYYTTGAEDVVKAYYKLFYNYDLSDAEYAQLTANSVFR